MSALVVASLVRALTAATVVVLASVLAEVLGPLWGALVISLPVTAGPVYVFMALEHETGFVAGAALNGFAANAATGLLLLTYARLATDRSLLRSFGPAVLAWLAAALPIAAVTWTPLTAFLLNVAVYGVGMALVRPSARSVLAPAAAVARPRPRDLLLRAAAVALFVSGVLAVSAILGPARTGVIAAYPVTLTSAFVILHRRLGGAAMARMAAMTIRGVFGFGLTLLTLHLSIERWGAPAALATALLVSLVWSAGLLALQRRPARAQAARTVARNRATSEERYSDWRDSSPEADRT
ncbi:hypothetical protein [Methylobacterium aerolatum]|uniref:Uncharacterized protein n=1 Tax=Methylobacterium aerolatum TaxID=418708 RepID=A0ABU0I4U7_9HYPH|nr:hypothetical protein [Methylobacterium aerolatum]MDQ0449643.1 hypothetical protein [Methylobacterium aerolatum]GJD36069.1 hypothetical protein FMGBMHLM_2983 [Methylobacterium aerolatum]